MNTNLTQQLVAALTSQFQFRQAGDWLRQGVCPSCGKKELYTHGKTPKAVKCGKLNKCGYEAHVHELVPELFVDFNKAHPPLKKNPKATANAYMELMRGINPVKFGKSWDQGEFKHPKANKKTATVRFNIADGVAMERFVDTITITDSDGSKKDRKQNFIGKHGGHYWKPEGMEINEGDTVWIVEACIDALSLWALGIKAVAILSCYNFPKKLFEDYSGSKFWWVWALDNDPAGRKHIVKHHTTLEDMGKHSRAALPPGGPKKRDWNDLYQEGAFDDKDFRADCYYRGDLAIAKTAMEKGLLIWHRTSRPAFDLVFKTRTYWFSMEYEKFQKARDRLISEDELDDKKATEKAARQSGAITEIANCQVNFLYFQANKVTDESWYYARVDFPHRGKSVKNTFTGAQLSAGSEFKKRLLSIAPGAVFSGNTGHLNNIAKDQLYQLKSVETVDFVGYSKEHKAFITDKLAVSDGRTYKLNEEDFFQIGKTSVKTLCSSLSLQIGNAHDYDDSWRQHFWTAFGVKGVACLAFWIGSLFAEQIRAIEKSYPFLEVIGQAGAGKSTLLEFMWKLCGRLEYEGFDPSKSTNAARFRSFSQVSNLPVVLIESDRGDDTAKGKTFDPDELKTAFNGRPIMSRGVKNSGNDVYEPPFRGAMVISQNAEVNGSEAVMQRILHIRFDKSGHTHEGGIASKALEQMPIEKVSYWILSILQREADILDYFREWSPKYKDQLLKLDTIKTRRIALNHGQLLALVDIAIGALGLGKAEKSQVRKFVRSMAEAREKSVCQDHSTVQSFWEIYDFLTYKNPKRLNHSQKDDLIAINLNEFIQAATEAKQQLPDLAELKRQLKTSEARKFIATKAVRSGIKTDSEGKPATVKCWVFKAEEKEQ